MRTQQLRLRVLLWIVCLITLVIWVVVMRMKNSMSDREETLLKMELMRVCLHEYASNAGKPPFRLDREVILSRCQHLVKDGWGQEMSMEITQADQQLTMTMISLGSDGLIGGTGEASDVTLQCVIVDQNGQLQSYLTEPIKVEW